jgi:arsenate reductase (thioredoxin)
MKQDNKQLVLFVCEHGSAKSVVAAAHFNRLARERNLFVRSISRGTDPDEEIPLFIVEGLEAEGLASGELKPKLLSKDDLAGALRIAAFCELPDRYGTHGPIERWTDVPPISEAYDKSRDVILARIINLLEEMAPNDRRV